MADSTASRADKVAELVQKLKRGEITKGEMFQQLSALSKPGGQPSKLPSPAQEPASAREDLPSSQEGSPKIQTESRQSMMQRLLDEKRRARQGASPPQQQNAAAPVPPTPEQPTEPTRDADGGWAAAPPLPQSSHSSLPEHEASSSSEQHDSSSVHERNPLHDLPAGFPPPPPPPANVDAAAYYAAYAAAIAQASQGGFQHDDNSLSGEAAPPFEQFEDQASQPAQHGEPSPQQQQQQAQGRPPRQGAASAQRRTPRGSNPTRERRLSAQKPPPSARSRGGYDEALQALEAVPFEERQRQWRQHKDAERQRRAAEKEAAELAECTFKPNTNANTAGDGGVRPPLPRHRRLSGASSVGSRESGVPIHERLFSAETPATRAKRRERVRGRASEQQSFEAGEGEAEHTSQNTERAEWVSVATSQGKPSRMSVAARSAGGNKNAVPTSEELELEECTFKPKVQPNRGRLSATPVRSKFMEHLKGGEGGSRVRAVSNAKKRPPIPSGLEECTFKPKVNPSKVDAAYASQNVFQRLASAQRSRPSSAARARPAARGTPGSAAASRSGSARRAARSATSSTATSPAHSEQRVGTTGPPVMDVQGFLAAMGGGGAGAQQQQARGRPSGSAASSVTGDSSGSSGSSSPGGKRGVTLPKDEYERRFKSFLERQNAAHRNRERKLEATKSQLQPSHRPQLCSKSLDLIEKNASGSFLDRISKGAVRQEQHALQQRAAVSMDPECTFAPRINPSSRKRPARSAAEMSVGDALKRETAVRLMRLRAEQEELDGATFKPAINPASAAAGGRLRIQDDPDNYVRRVSEAAAVAEKRTRLAQLETSRAELQECTFKPQVHDAPMFVKRIARSMALTKAVHPPPSEESKKPEWR